MNQTLKKRIFRRTYTSLAVLWFLCGAASAADATGNSTMAIFADVPGAQEILAGKYQQAIRIMAITRRSGEMRVVIANNLCVAYTLDRQFNSAQLSCDEAVREAGNSRNYGNDSFARNMAHRKMRRDKAQARSNRAMLRSISRSGQGSL